MASKPKNTAKGKNARGSSASGRKNETTRNSAEVSFGNEVALLVILAVCIIMFISNFGIGGFIGEKVSGFCFGMFGMMAYLFPVCFFVGAAFFVSNKDNGIALVKLTAGVVFVVFLCLFMELIAGDSAFGLSMEDLQTAMDPKRYIGRAPEQVDEFLKEIVRPILEKNKEVLGAKAEILV